MENRNPCLGQLTSTGQAASYSALLFLTSLAINSRVSLGALRGIEGSVEYGVQRSWIQPPGGIVWKIL